MTDNPRLKHFRVIDDVPYPYHRFKEHPHEPGRVELWGSVDRRYWTLLEII